jgi:hypothetical protein
VFVVQGWEQASQNTIYLRSTVNDEKQHKPPTTINTGEQEVGLYATEH